ncbi:MAG TPA: LacI family DNA-binding transcriptional regulator [Candidatus Angelobacter sp.]|jgi:LacI family transcriptional regulator|nr:LacI family DNA-binding transcriptional regulator [Candidatus Angelobacter sp.]
MKGPRSRKESVTIRDVARESGFAASTVSIVLNNAPLARYIPPTTKARIQRTAKTLGYHPNIFAKSLRSKRNHTVGVILFDITDPYCTLILRGIEKSLYQESYLSILADAHNEHARFERYLEMMLERRVEGLLVLANWLYLDINVLADLERGKVPTVIIGRELESNATSSVTVDDEGGAYAAIAHLYSLGHRKIAFIRGPRALSSSKARWRGVQRFARDTRLDIDPKLVIDLPDQGNPNAGVDDASRITEELLKQKRTFTALMAYDDMTAFGALRGLAKAGIKVPQECSVIGFDDVNPSHLFVPALTTVRQPMEAMGASAVSILLQGISSVADNRSPVAVHRKLPAELVVRESTEVITR